MLNEYQFTFMDTIWLFRTNFSYDIKLYNNMNLATNTLSKQHPLSDIVAI